MDDIRTIADTVIWIGDERMKNGGYQNRNSAIHSVVMDVSLLIQDEMAKGRRTAPQRSVKANDKSRISGQC